MSFLVGFLPKTGDSHQFEDIALPGFQWLGSNAHDSGAFWCYGELSHSVRLELTPKRSLALVGRVRLDRRETLAESLGEPLSVRGTGAGDAELVLRAYDRWGQDMIDRVHGDFAFVIWDSGTRELFCARDRLGIRPLAYFKTPSCWWISDSIELLAQAPGYSDGEPDPIWIAHFLRHGSGDPSRAAYSHVHRLLPAHTLSLVGGAATEQRYWSFQIGTPLFLESSSAYIDRFNALLTAAIRDRMPEGTVGVSMSGGIDSPALAAVAVEVAGTPDRVVARTTVLHGKDDAEWTPSRLAARHLGIGHELVEVESLIYDPAWQKKDQRFAEPNIEITFPSGWTDQRRAMRDVSPVWFYGEGPDNALTFEWSSYLGWLARQRRWADLALASMRYLGAKSLSEWKLTIQKLLRPVSHIEDPPTPWIAAFAHERSQEANIVAGPITKWRPRAQNSWEAIYLWANLLEELDSVNVSHDLEWRHPYLDLELLEFMVRTPPIPWARNKRLLRQAMKSRLPDAVVTNPKFVGRSDVIGDAIRAAPPTLPRKGSPVEAFVALEKIPEDPFISGDPHRLLRLAVVDHWLGGRSRTQHG